MGDDIDAGQPQWRTGRYSQRIECFSQKCSYVVIRTDVLQAGGKLSTLNLPIKRDQDCAAAVLTEKEYHRPKKRRVVGEVTHITGLAGITVDHETGEISLVHPGSQTFHSSGELKLDSAHPHAFRQDMSPSPRSI